MRSFTLTHNGQQLEFVQTKGVWVCVLTDFQADVIQEQNILNSAVDILELSARAANCLKAESIRTLRDLVNTEANYVRYRIPNLGVTTYIEICKALAQHGLELKNLKDLRTK